MTNMPDVSITADQGRPLSSSEEISPACKSDEPVLDRQLAQSRAANDDGALIELIRLFHDMQPQILEQISSAIAGNDAEDLSTAAHSFIGPVSFFTNGWLVDALRSLESAVQTKEAEHWPVYANKVETGCRILSAELEEWQQELKTGALQ